MLGYSLNFCTTDGVGLQLEIQLMNELYTLGKDGATGKTYLAEILRSVIQRGLINAYVVSYVEDSVYQKSLIKQALQGCYDLVMFDRADLYIKPEDIEGIWECSKKTSVLLDAKWIPGISDRLTKPVCFKYGNSKMEVIDCDSIRR